MAAMPDAHRERILDESVEAIRKAMASGMPKGHPIRAEGEACLDALVAQIEQQFADAASLRRQLKDERS